jgi:hypothetical protein
MKRLLIVIATSTLLSLSINAKADKNEAMVEMIVSMMKKSGEISGLSRCLGITEDSFLNAYKKTIEVCIPKDGLEGNCMEESASEVFGISKAKFDACTNDDTELSDQEENIDFSTLSEEEKMAFIEKQQAEGLARMEEMADLMKKASEGTENDITLPVYNPSSLTSHYVNGMESNSGKKTLPVATFTTSDSVEKVIEFYEESLPTFKVSKSGEIYYVMKEVPNNLFQLSMDMENLPLYSVPHIETYSLIMSGEETTLIVISYKPN